MNLIIIGKKARSLCIFFDCELQRLRDFLTVVSVFKFVFNSYHLKIYAKTFRPELIHQKKNLKKNM
jgi:hypothetical protein